MVFMKGLNEILDEEFNCSETENGAIGYRTTGNKLLDINFFVSSLRNASDDVIIEYFSKAYFENKLLAVKWLFFASDVRGGMGERRLFRVCINWLAKENPDAVKRLIKYIPEYSRWDNMLNLLDTDLCADVIELIKAQLEEDEKNMIDNKPVSLLAKWLPSENASSPVTKRYAEIILNGLEMSPRAYRKTLSELRKYLRVVEVSMSAGEWGSIDYSAVPSRANLIYKEAFLRNDEERRREFLGKLEKGEAKINSAVLFPHDIVHRYCIFTGWRMKLKNFDATLEELWKALPDYVNGAGSTICVADGSGSMLSRVGRSVVTSLDVANALAIYFAERCSGEFKDKYITFSQNPQLVDLSAGKSLRDKINIACSHDEVSNTNIEAVFKLILMTAVKNKMAQEDLPQNILILSDMEFDSCVTSNNYNVGGRNWGEPPVRAKLFQDISAKFDSYGYKMPRLVFWNICSRSGTIPLRENKLGVALVSGFSTSVMKMVLSNKSDPFECLLDTLDSERYAPIDEAVGELLR